MCDNSPLARARVRARAHVLDDPLGFVSARENNLFLIPSEPNPVIIGARMG